MNDPYTHTVDLYVKPTNPLLTPTEAIERYELIARDSLDARVQALKLMEQTGAYRYEIRPRQP